MAASVKRNYGKGKDGRKLPSVTEILGNLGWKYQVLIHWANKVGRQGLTVREASGDAAKVGNIAHDRIEAWVLGKVFERTNEPQDLWDRSTMAFESFKDWWHTENMSGRIEVIETECLMSDVEAGFGGTADLICLLDGVPAVLDYKTGSGIYPEVAVQLEAYADLWQTVGCTHTELSDGTPISEEGQRNRKACGEILRTGVIHCPADGRKTQMLEIPAETRKTAGQIWDSLLSMEALKTGYNDFGDWLKHQTAKPEEPEPKVPF